MGFHKSYTLPTTLGVYRPNRHGLTTPNLGGSGHELGILSFGGSATSSLHYIPGLSPRLWVYRISEVTMVISQGGNLKPSLAAYCVCKLRWNQAVRGPRVLTTMEPSCTRSSRTVPWVQAPQVLTLRTMGPSTLSTQVNFNSRNRKSTLVAKGDANGRNLKSSPVEKVDANSRT
jgi:hypothetical protein